jgi:hypothetical protein
MPSLSVLRDGLSVCVPTALIEEEVDLKRHVHIVDSDVEERDEQLRHLDLAKFGMLDDTLAIVAVSGFLPNPFILQCTLRKSDQNTSKGERAVFVTQN